MTKKKKEINLGIYLPLLIISGVVMDFQKYKESAKGAVYHIFNRGNNRQDIFCEESDFAYYLNKMQLSEEKNNFSLITYCLMPNHIHLLVKQRGDSPPATFIASLHTSYSMYFNKKYKTVGHLFQGRYKQKIINDNEYLELVVSYIHENPVKSKISQSKDSYRWSGYRDFLSIQKNGTSKHCDPTLVKELNLLTNTSPHNKTMNDYLDFSHFLGQS